jgi:DUF4097 and DUF4098 domain-containing protein YvlB
VKLFAHSAVKLYENNEWRLQKMNSKWIIAIFLIMALVATCAAGVFAIWQGVQMAQMSGFSFSTGSFNTVEATGTEQKTLSVSGPQKLNVENNYGFIKIEAGAVDEVQVTAEKTTWGGTEEEAQQALENIQVQVEQKGDEIRIWVKPVVEVTAFHLGPRGHWVHFTITVPPETSVNLSSSNGDLMLSGTQGAATLKTSFGEIEVSDLTGGLLATTSNGKITARNIDAGEAPVSLKTDFGDIEANTISAGDVTLKSTNGKLTLEKVETSGALDVRSDFGGLELRSVNALSLEAHTSNGKVQVKEAEFSGTVNVSSNFGDLTLEGVRSNGMELKTQNGEVTVSGAAGKITAHSDYGDVEVSADKALVTLTSNNGKITFTGSLAEGDHTLKSNFGDIRLSLPAETALTIDLKTDFGKIKSDFPVTISGELDEKRWKGDINGGGARLTVSTQNGNISLQISK